MSYKHLWTEDQDQFLRKVVPKNGRVDWAKVKQNLNQNFGSKQRSSKQCRERYINYSKFQQRNSESAKWKPQQLTILFEQFNKWGPRWNTISKYLPQKSGNSIKNRFYGGLRKAIRSLNHMDKSQKGNIKKKLKYESAVRIIEAPQCLSNLDSQLKRQSLEIRQKLIGLVSNCEELSQRDASNLICRINKFNLNTRSYRRRRKNNCQFDQNCEQLRTDVKKQQKQKEVDGTLQQEQKGEQKLAEREVVVESGVLAQECGQLDWGLKQIEERGAKLGNEFDEQIMDLFREQHSPLESNLI